MAKNKADKKRKKARQNLKQARAEAKWKDEMEMLNTFRRQSPYIKKVLKARGHVFPFYDYIDSYSNAFKQIAEVAIATHPTLIGVYEVDDEENSGEFWEKFGHTGLNQINYKIDDSIKDYGTRSNLSEANIEGGMTSFWDIENNLRSIITIKKNFKSNFRLGELRYVMKIAALFHEIGHVKDLELGINFDIKTRTLNVIEAEVYANLYALEEMKNRNMFHSYNMLLTGLQGTASQGGYAAEVLELVLARLPESRPIDWQPLFYGEKLTGDEIEMIGDTGMRTFAA